MRKAFTIITALSLAIVVGVPLATIGVTGTKELAAKPAPMVAAPTRTVEDVRTQWGGNKPKAEPAPVGTTQERARWACSNAVERVAVDAKSIRWTRRSQWVSVETDPGVWQVHAHFMARNRLGNDVAATHACTMRLVGNDFVLIKG